MLIYQCLRWVIIMSNKEKIAGYSFTVNFRNGYISISRWLRFRSFPPFSGRSILTDRWDEHRYISKLNFDRFVKCFVNDRGYNYGLSSCVVDGQQMTITFVESYLIGETAK
jgi:hypothetical protein